MSYQNPKSTVADYTAIGKGIADFGRNYAAGKLLLLLLKIKTL